MKGAGGFKSVYGVPQADPPTGALTSELTWWYLLVGIVDAGAHCDLGRRNCQITRSSMTWLLSHRYTEMGFEGSYVMKAAPFPPIGLPYYHWPCNKLTLPHRDAQLMFCLGLPVLSMTCCLSICLTVLSSINPPTHPSIIQSTHITHPSIHLFVHPNCCVPNTFCLPGMPFESSLYGESHWMLWTADYL